MAKRELTERERVLWHHYTKDVQRLAPEIKIPSLNPPQGKRGEKRFEIKVPSRNNFKQTNQMATTNYENLKNKDQNWGKKLSGGKIKPDGKIDLHGMTCVEAHEKLFTYLQRAQSKGKRVILVITGKGGPKNNYDEYRFSDYENSLGVLRREVPLWLSGGAMRQLVLSYQDARRTDGGTGALYVVLKRIK